jgi:tetraacyldisaccharide 4'-kinase
MKKYLLSVMKGQKKDLQASIIICLLLPFSFIYRIGAICHRLNCHFKGVFRAPKPVVSIGNITVGGVGKTPLVIWLARHLQEKGVKPVILMRGYMPKNSSSSDEADMLNEQIPYIPILAGADRIANIVKSKGSFPVDVYLCDDAFQHWPLFRDLNIVVIDAGNPFGNGHLLPAGILREPLSALKRADVLLLTKIDDSNDIQDLSKKLKKINRNALIVESRYKSAGAVDVFDTKRLPEYYLKDFEVAAFCAIGDPLSFECSLSNCGAKIIKLFTYMDHHVYTKSDIVSMVQFCRSKCIPVLVTTHKDAVKLRAFKDLFEGFRVVYIPIQLEITKGSDEFIQKVISVCRY